MAAEQRDPAPVEEKESENAQKTFRLHVGGLGPTVLPQDLERRFSSFGTVTKVAGVGKLDANGSPLHYAFVDILSTDLQIKRCMNLLSGTTYKGSTLRIAPARPDYIARAQREQANLPINTFVEPDEAALQEREEKAALKLERKLAKMRARRRGIEGYQSANMELMSVKKFKSQKGVNGWKKEPETSLPIFPLITRPLRPLPPLEPTPSAEGDTKETCPVARVPNRARRVRIDPTLYRAAIKHRKTHLLGPRAISIEQYKLGFAGGAKNFKKNKAAPPLWQCHLSEDGQVVWKLHNADAAQEERVQLSTYTLKQFREASKSSLCESNHPAASKAVATSVDLSISSQCGKGDSNPPENQPTVPQSLNSAVASNNLVSPKQDPICSPNVSESFRDEASIESAPALATGTCSGLSSTTPLRLRGGSSVKKVGRLERSPEVQLSNLTDMFKAKEEEKKGFCLDDALEGMELDENMLEVPDSPQVEATPSLKLEKVQEGKHAKSKAFIHPSRLNGSSLLSSQIPNSMKPSGGRKGPFFFYPTDEDPDSQVINSLLSTERRESAREHWLSHDLPSSSNSNGWRIFMTDEAISQIESEHNQKKSQLTEHMRRKHKDAVKLERKRGTKPLES